MNKLDLRPFRALEYIKTDEDLTALLDAYVKESLESAHARIFDLLFGDDGQAYKEAQRYLEREAPELYAKLEAATQGVTDCALAQGAVYAEMPTNPWPFDNRAQSVMMGGYSEDELRDFADRTHALRASHGQAPAQPAGSIYRNSVSGEFELDYAGEDHQKGMHVDFYLDPPTPSPQAAQQAPAGAAQQAPAAEEVEMVSMVVQVGTQGFDLASTSAHFTSADMYTASAQAFREGQAAAPSTPEAGGELLELALAQKEYIDALPDDVVAKLPAMPGFDGDWAAEVLERAQTLPVFPTIEGESK